MKKNILLCFIMFCFVGNIFSQTKTLVDVVYLKNGNVVRGFVLENNPGVDIKFKSVDGSIMIYSYGDFTKMDKEEYEIKKSSSVEQVKYEKQSFVLVGIALHPSQTSGYIMYGKLKNYGGYLKLQTNLNFKTGFDVEGDSWNDRYFNDIVHTGRLGISGGALWRVLNPIILYGGLGYGSRWVNWETISGDQFRVDDASYRGVELEAGAIFKVKKMFFTGGISWIPVSYMELSIGAGFSL